VNRLTVGISYDTGQTLREYSARISSILELEHLAEAVMGLIGETMDVRRGALFTVHEEGKGQESYFRLQSVKGMGQELQPVVLSADSPIVKYLMREHHPLTQYDIDLLPHFQDTPPEERAWFTGLDMDVCVPICSKGQWIGMLALGRKASGDRYFGDDLALLSMLADQTAVALENARLFNDLRMRHLENERLNQQLTAANIELSRLGQAKSDFIDIASHELRTPLTQVCGYNDMLGEMIQEGTLTIEMGMKMTTSVKAAAARLTKIVATMLDVSRIDTETLELDVSSASIASIMSRVVSAWTHALDERKQVLTVTDLGDLPSVTADDERLEQVFSCLVQNALKYTPDGGRIQISGRVLGDPQELTVEVVVADSGIGIAREDLERVFEKFYRVGDVLLHSTGETKFKGAGPGLGLTIARGIVEAHGGHIWAESPGRDEEACLGAKFHVLLPVQFSRIELAGLDAVEDSRA
jgi:signal transduction histidine kinase